MEKLVLLCICYTISFDHCSVTAGDCESDYCTVTARNGDGEPIFPARCIHKYIYTVHA